MATNSGQKQCFSETKDEHTYPIQSASIAKLSLLSQATRDTWIGEIVSLLFGTVCFLVAAI
jgi:hypothetical protein